MFAYRITLVCLILSLVASSNASAKEWAERMFHVTAHDFGTVARGAKAEFTFVVENIYQEDVHIADIHSSCGCTTPTVSKRTLKTWEKSNIVATYNSRKFLGQRNATITVRFDKPYPAEVQLQISGFIRGDVVLRPGSVEFGDVEIGQTPQRKLVVDYAGNKDWRLVDVRSSSRRFDASLKELKRGNGRVSYELTLGLDSTDDPGYLKEQIILVSNDRQQSRIPITVSGRILPAVTVSPASLAMGVVRGKQKVTKQLVVRAKDPFKIVAVHCSDDRFAFKTSEQSKRMHLVPVSFSSNDKDGPVSCQITVETDLDAGQKAICSATATVKKAAAE